MTEFINLPRSVTFNLVVDNEVVQHLGVTINDWTENRSMMLDRLCRMARELIRDRFGRDRSFTIVQRPDDLSQEPIEVFRLAVPTSPIPRRHQPLVFDVVCQATPIDTLEVGPIEYQCAQSMTRRWLEERANQIIFDRFGEYRPFQLIERASTFSSDLPPSPPAFSICHGCQDFIGKSYYAHGSMEKRPTFVCAMHPYGPEGDQCPDFREKLPREPKEPPVTTQPGQVTFALQNDRESVDLVSRTRRAGVSLSEVTDMINTLMQGRRFGRRRAIEAVSCHLDSLIRMRTIRDEEAETMNRARQEESIEWIDPMRYTLPSPRMSFFDEFVRAMHSPLTPPILNTAPTEADAEQRLIARLQEDRPGISKAIARCRINNFLNRHNLTCLKLLELVQQGKVKIKFGNLTQGKKFPKPPKKFEP